MHIKWMNLWLFAVLLCGTGVVVAQDKVEVERQKLMKKAEADLRQAEETYKDMVARINEEAIAKYERLIKGATQRGDLEEAVTLNNKIAALRGAHPLKLQSTAEEGPSKPMRSGDYPEGTFKVGRSHYYLLPEAMDIRSAIAACEALGGHVLSLDDKREYDHFHKFCGEQKISIWLDLSDAEKEGEWRNWQGRPASYERWHEGEPNGAEKQTHVMLGLADGKWHMRDAPSSEQHRVICEWD